MSLTAGPYFTFQDFGDPTSFTLDEYDVPDRPGDAGDTPRKSPNHIKIRVILNFFTIEEHVFELGYIGQFLGDPPPGGQQSFTTLGAQDCQWFVNLRQNIDYITELYSRLSDNIFNYPVPGGGTVGLQLVQAIDQVSR